MAPSPSASSSAQQSCPSAASWPSGRAAGEGTGHLRGEITPQRRWGTLSFTSYPALPPQDLFGPSPPVRWGWSPPGHRYGGTFTSGCCSLPGEPDSASLAAASCFFHSSMSCSAFLGEGQEGCAEPGECRTAASFLPPLTAPSSPQPSSKISDHPKGIPEPQPCLWLLLITPKWGQVPQISSQPSKTETPMPPPTL